MAMPRLPTHNNPLLNIKLSELSADLSEDYILTETNRIHQQVLKLCKRNSNSNDESFDLINNQFELLLQDCERLKGQAVQAGFFSAEEAQNIIRAATLDAREFFPVYQEFVDRKIARIFAETSDYISNKKLEATQITDGLTKRAWFHIPNIAAGVIFTLVAPIGFVYWAASSLMALLDAGIACCRYAINAIQTEIAVNAQSKKIEAVKQEIQQKIESDPVTKFRQGFFQINKELNAQSRQISISSVEHERSNLRLVK